MFFFFSFLWYYKICPKIEIDNPEVIVYIKIKLEEQFDLEMHHLQFSSYFLHISQSSQIELLKFNPSPAEPGYVLPLQTV